MEDTNTRETTLNAHVTERRNTKSIARHLPIAGRVSMGLIFSLTGFNGFLNFGPRATMPLPDDAAEFIGALLATRYMFPLVMGIEIIVGGLLLSNRFVPLALVLITPIVVNIVAFHVFLAPSGSVLAVVVLALEVYLAWVYRKSFRPMLAMHTTLGNRLTKDT